MAKFFLIFLLSVTAAHAQTGMVSGRIVDKDSQKGLSGATIKVSRVKDSSMTGIATSIADGSFSIDGIPFHDSLRVEVSYSGYDSFKGILISNGKHFVMENIYLHPVAKILDEVIVTSSAPMAQIKGDTIEFKADAYKLPPNSMAGDLIKRIPGLTIGKGGKLFFNGQPVTSILVDGREFFSSEGGVALENIPVTLIDKIQLSDTKKVGEAILDRPLSVNNDKTLNIKMKPGKKYFGNLAAGGANERYNISGLASSMAGNEWLNFKGGINNTNNTGSSLSPGAESWMADGGGVTKTISSGLEYSAGKPIENYSRAIYEFKQPTTNAEKIIQNLQNILPGTQLNSNSIINNANKNTSQSFGFTRDKRNPTQTAVFRYSGSINNQVLDNNSTIELVTKDAQGKLLNELNSHYNSKGNIVQLENKVNFTIPVGQSKKKSTLRLAFGLNYAEQRSKDQNIAVSSFYKSNILDSVLPTRQAIDNFNSSKRVNTGISYGTVLGKLRATISNDFSYQWRRVQKNSWELDSNNKRGAIDSLYSNSFNSNLLSNKTEILLFYYTRKWQLVCSGILQELFQQQTDLSRNSILRNSQVNLSPVIQFTYAAGTGAAIKLDITSSNSAPSLEQLQPVQDNSNPLYLKLGNPDLRTAINYTSTLGYLKSIIRPSKFFLINADISFFPVLNKITAATIYDSLNRQIMQFRNVNGTYTIAQKAGFSANLKHGTTHFEFSVTSLVTFQHDKLYLNGTLLGMNISSFTPAVDLKYYHDDEIGYFISYSPAINKIVYQQNNMQEQSYTIHKVRAVVNLYIAKQFKFDNTIIYTHNNGVPAGFAKSTFSDNAAISYLGLKDKKAEFRISGFDIFDQNRNVTHSVIGNGITDTQTNNLGRFFLFSVIYHFDVMKKIN